MFPTVAFTPHPAQPIDELIGFLKQGDNYQQDTRSWPDPTEPRASTPPMGKGCTCAEGQKLDCPIHGMHADPELAELDHTWSMPQAQPIGYQQDGPRNWTQAVSSQHSFGQVPCFDAKDQGNMALVNHHDDPKDADGQQTDQHCPHQEFKQAQCVKEKSSYVSHFSPRNSSLDDIGDTNTQANLDRVDHQTSLGSNNHRSDVECPGRFQAGDRLQSRRFGVFGNEVRDAPKFDSFVVTNRQSQSIKSLDNFNDVVSDFVPFGIIKSRGPFVERADDGAQCLGQTHVDGSRFGFHDSVPEMIIEPEPLNQAGDDITKAKQHASDIQAKAKRYTQNTEKDSTPANHVTQPERHKESVTRVGAKSVTLRKYKPGKFGKGIISEDGNTIIVWRIKKGWNGTPHHDSVKEVLALEQEDVAFHVDQNGMFYFHDEDTDFDPPKNPDLLVKCIEAEDLGLKWGKISVEEYDRRHGIVE